MENVTLGSAVNISSDSCYPCIVPDLFIPSISVYVLLSFPANGWAMWLMTSSAVFLTDKMELFEFNLVLSELLFCAASPAVCAGLYYFRGLADKIAIPITAVSFVIRPMFQGCLCVERYLAVIHPVVFLRYKPLRYRLFCCGLVWAVSAYSIVAPWIVCVAKSPAFVDVCAAAFGLLFLLNSFCSLSVLRALRRAGPGEGHEGRGEGVSNRLKGKAFRTVLIIQATIVVSYVPTLVATLLIGHFAEATICQVHPATIVTSLWCGLVHPVLYLHRARKLPCRRPQAA